jgi:hypothetical protein
MPVDLKQLFAMNAPVIEIVLWGIVLYLLLLVLLRHVLRRHGIFFGFAEALLLVLFADASQNMLAGESRSLAESALLAISLVVCHLLWRGGRRVARRLRRAQVARGLQRMPDDLPTTFTERKPS